MRYLTTDLIAAIKRDASIPSSQRRFQNDDFLAFLNEELQLTIVGELLAMRQDYFVTTVDTALVASQSNYTMPTSAVGWKLEAVWYLDTSSKEYRLPLITREQRGAYRNNSSGVSPAAVYVLNDEIRTVPDMGATVSGSLRYDFVRIQNEMVLPSSCGKITSVTDTGTDYQMTVETVPVSTGDSVDVVSGTNPYNVFARSVTTSISGSIITVTYGSSFGRAPVAGDYVCPVGKTPVANIPEDFHPVLAQAGTVRCLISANDTKGIQTQSLSLQNMLTRMRNRAGKRINDAPRKIVPNNYILNLSRGIY